MMVEKAKQLLTDEVRQGGMWVVAFVCVTVLIGLDKVKPEALEYLLFALIGRSSGVKSQTQGKVKSDE